jgi:hypothetical protein
MGGDEEPIRRRGQAAGHPLGFRQGQPVRLPRMRHGGVVCTNLLESARNRPERYGPPTRVDTTNPIYTRFAELVRTGMDPAEVARRVLAAIRDDELYVFTHPEMPWRRRRTLSGDPCRVRQGSSSSGVKSLPMLSR